MKRYKIVPVAHDSDTGWDTKWSTQAVEDLHGGWVKWEEAEHTLNMLGDAAVRGAKEKGFNHR